ncbi:hypothetical protein, partial [Salmonella enterica]|uniref:hypothetical protein n=1 Tax=Salmonella enterica TaxID=28901 RepID=UPI0016543187
VMERDSVVGILTKIDLIEFLSKKNAEVPAVSKPKALKAKSSLRDPRKAKKKSKTAMNGARA